MVVRPSADVVLFSKSGGDPSCNAPVISVAWCPFDGGKHVLGVTADGKLKIEYFLLGYRKRITT